MKRWTPRAIVLTAWAIFVVSAYPGYIDEAGLNMLADTRGGWYSGMQSPTMTWLWGRMELLLAGPVGMFLLQGTALLLCAYWVLRDRLSDRAAAYVAGALLLLPPVLATSSIVCADAQLATYLLLGFVGVRSARRPAQIAGFAALLVAACVRPLGAAAVLPLVAFSLRIPERWKQIAAALVVTILLGLTSVAVNRALTDGDLSPDVRTDRVTAFAQELGVRPVRSWRPTYTRYVPQRDAGKALYLMAGRSRAQTVFERIVRASGRTPLFWPYLYFIVAVGLVGFLALRRDPMPLALVSSGVAYELALYWGNGDPRFEHSHWMIISTLLAAALTWRRFRRAPSPAETRDPLPPAESPSPSSGS